MRSTHPARVAAGLTIGRHCSALWGCACGDLAVGPRRVIAYVPIIRHTARKQLRHRDITVALPASYAELL